METQSTTMTTHEVAKKLHELCSTNQYDKAQAELFADHVKSIEPAHAQGMPTVEGKEALAEKSKAFQSTITEVHGGYVKEPVVFGPYIFMEMGMDVTMGERGRMNMDEMCKYEVKDGQIISEEFFY